MPNRGDGSEDSTGDLPPLQKLDSPTGSPPSSSLSRLIELENCVSNLSLAHEIVVNRDFSFKPNSPPTNSLEGTVTEIVHKAFWDCLQQQLNSDPPDYSHAMVLLQETKTLLESLLLPGHVRLRAELDEVLDMELIKQEVSQGALDLNRLAAYVINTMGSLCAPVRDQEIRALRHLQEPVELFRGIFRVLGLMKIDMVNFTVQTLRPHLMQQAVQYERAKFQQILDKDPASLDNTVAWLHAAASEEMSSVRSGPVSVMSVLNRAYMHLLRWSPLDQKYPETVLMDRARLDSLGEQVWSLTLDASVLLVTSAQCGGAVWSLPGFLGKLKRSITALLEGSHSSEADLTGALQRVAEKVVQQVNEARCSQENTSLPKENQEILKGQIEELWRDNNPVRILIGERVQGFLQAMLQGGPPKRSPELASPLRLLSADLAELGRAFGQIVHFNRSVFGPFYAPILRRALFPSGEPETADDQR
ncbi:hypothetical protein NL108_010294 [Boleophthalmus pectinirostris]|uniref:T-complex protein 11-like protein 1 n=1 Tax=Boleophthalmus pectinirostris TaxID=150288 RepID=UPI000A1C6B2D|nr:T-complex protein 11-like protein 1 [Boleophthalmus pectinirostris]XP_020796081.1 T-complex protein 11-like protein 1 [Boleophthalmus pectinirostris]KAJ0068630.1 hypothetical protein NL108_010294 [Boleophthalmus pectinirostris]